MAYVYRHIRLDTNEIFYIGIGEDNINRKEKYRRAHTKIKDSHNNWWNKIVNKTQYRVEILMNGLTWEQACWNEIFLISLYGRRDLGKGTLVNLTNGGEGTTGCKYIRESPSIETRKKLSEALKGNKHTLGIKYSDEEKYRMGNGNRNKKFSDSTKAKMRESNLGKKYSIEFKEKISKSLKGRPSKHIRRIFCFQNNKTYNSLKEAKEDLNLEIKNTGPISAVWSGKSKHIKGYTFKYLD